MCSHYLRRIDSRGTLRGRRILEAAARWWPRQRGPEAEARAGSCDGLDAWHVIRLERSDLVVMKFGVIINGCSPPPPKFNINLCWPNCITYSTNINVGNISTYACRYVGMACFLRLLPAYLPAYLPTYLLEVSDRQMVTNTDIMFSVLSFAYPDVRHISERQSTARTPPLCSSGASGTSASATTSPRTVYRRSEADRCRRRCCSEQSMDGDVDVEETSTPTGFFAAKNVDRELRCSGYFRSWN